MPSRPHSRAALITSHGVDSSASCLAATGRITSAANRRHRARNSRCSSLTPKSIFSPPWSAARWTASLAHNRLTGQSTSRRVPRRGLAVGMLPAVWVSGRRRLALLAAALVAIAALGVGAYLLAEARDGDDQSRSAAPIVVHEPQPDSADELGFPALATKNTTRVAGADPVADAAGVALAVFPSTGGVEGPD